MSDDPFNTLPMRQLLKKCVNLYRKEEPMTTTPPGASEPREFTWYNCTHEQMVVSGIRTDGACHRCKEVVHLVEKSAYDALKAERDELLIKCNRWKEIAVDDKCLDAGDVGLFDDLMKARKERDRYREALERIVNEKWILLRKDLDRLLDIAREALTQNGYNSTQIGLEGKDLDRLLDIARAALARKPGGAES